MTTRGMIKIKLNPNTDLIGGQHFHVEQMIS